MRLTRKQFLATGTGLAAAAILHFPADAAEFRFKLGHDQPADHPQTVRAMEAAAKIKEESGGQLIVQVFPNSQLGGDTQMLAQLRSGALELMQLGDNILANVVPSASLTSLPFVFADYKQLWTAMDGSFGGYIHAQIEKTGLHVVGRGWDAGLRHVFTNTRAVHNAADMKGLKLRVPEAPVQLAFFRALGSSPTPVNNNELYTAIQTHLVDGAEQPLISIETARLYEVSRYISLTRHQPTPFEMLANGNAWKRLTPKLQDILARNLDAAALREREDIVNGEAALQKRLRNQGQTIITPDRESFRKVIASAGLYAKWRDTYGEEPFSLLEKYAGSLV